MSLIAGFIAALLFADGGIRNVDFKNFTYAVGEQRITLQDGHGAAADPVDPSVVTEVTRVDVAYGDLSGDGQEEAVVVLGIRMGGTGYFTSGLVFGLHRKAPVVLAMVSGGDRAQSGIVSARIEQRRLLVERNEGTCSTCVRAIVTTSYALRRGRLIPQSTSRRAVRGDH